MKNSKLKNITTDYEFSQEFDVKISEENVETLFVDFKDTYKKKIQEFERVEKVVETLMMNSNTLIDVEQKGISILNLEKNNSYFIKKRLPMCDDRTFLKHILNDGAKFSIYMMNLRNKLELYKSSMDTFYKEYEKASGSEISSEDLAQSRRLKNCSEIYGKILIHLETTKKDLKLEFDKINNYLDILKDFDFEEYEKIFDVSL